MATKPADPATVIPWATDDTLTSGDDVGLSTKLAPTLGEAEQGCVPGQSAAGRLFNFLFNQFYLWCAYVNDLHNSVDFLNKAYAWTGAHTHTQSVTTDGDLRLFGEVKYTSAGVAAPRARDIGIPLSDFERAAGTWTYGGLLGSNVWSIDLASGTGAQILYAEIKPPLAATVTSFSLGLTSANATPTLEVFQVTRDDSTGLNVSASLGTDTSISSGKLSVGFSAVTVTDDTTFVVKYTSGTGGNPESIFNLKMAINDPGPTNG